MVLQHSMTMPLSSFISPIVVAKERKFYLSNSFFGTSCLSKPKQGNPSKEFMNLSLSSNILRVSLLASDRKPTRIQALKSDDADWKRRQEASSDSDDEEDEHTPLDANDPYLMSLEERKEWRRKIRELMDKKPNIQEDSDPVPPDGNDPYLMSLEERQEWREKIREVMDKKPDIQEELDPVEKKRKMEKLLNDYPLVMEEEDPDWPEDADGWGFSLGQFFDKITIKNNKKTNDDDDDNDGNEIVWQDDNYIRPIKDIKSLEWEETVFKDISPLIILVHNRYKRPKENERVRNEIEKAVHIIWNCRLPSPRCVALDAVVETELVAALQVSVFPEIIFTKAGKILYREKATRNADELSKIMAFFYYGAAKPTCLNSITNCQEDVPSLIDNPVS